MFVDNADHYANAPPLNLDAMLQEVVNGIGEIFRQSRSRNGQNQQRKARKSDVISNVHIFAITRQSRIRRFQRSGLMLLGQR
jgi:hypothetical protein